MTSNRSKQDRRWCIARRAWLRWQLPLLLAGLAVAPTAPADPIAAVQLLREGGCGGTQPAAPSLRHNAVLDRAAERWAHGSSPAAAAGASGYEAERAAGLHINGPDSAAVAVLRRSSCRALGDRGLREIGAYRHGSETWLVLAAPRATPPSLAPEQATRVLQLVNEARARGTRCGERLFGRAPPVTSSGTLAGVALGHAADMAEHGYFEHADRAGHSPADRVRAVGYREKLVGENIAYGPTSPEEVVQGWLDSPGHCENIMDPRFAEMGVGYAAGGRSNRGPYWVQLLAAPRT